MELFLSIRNEERAGDLMGWESFWKVSAGGFGAEQCADVHEVENYT